MSGIVIVLRIAAFMTQLCVRCRTVLEHVTCTSLVLDAGAAQLHAEAGAARLRPGSRAAYVFASMSASRRLQIAASVLRTSFAATAAPLRLRHAGPATQLSVRSVRRTEDHVRKRRACGTRGEGTLCTCGCPSEQHIHRARARTAHGLTRRHLTDLRRVPLNPRAVWSLTISSARILVI